MPQIFTDVRTRNVGSDRRNDAWSPGNVLVDTVARMQQDLADIRAETDCCEHRGFHLWCMPLGRRRSRRLRYHGLVGRPVGNSTDRSLMQLCFLMVGMTQQRLYNCSPTWMETHLKVALLVPMSRRTSRTGLVDALSAHYGSPGRLVDNRRQFEKTTRSAEEDPFIFAIALETLAVEGFGDMGRTAYSFVIAL